MPDKQQNTTPIPGNTDPWWEAGALKAIETLATTGRNFTAADLTDLGVAEPDHSCRWGSLFAAAKRCGIVVRVGYAPARRAGRNGGVAAIWKGATEYVTEDKR